MCTVEGYPQATWFSDVDATGPLDAGGDPVNGVRCQQVSAIRAISIGRKVYNVLKILRSLPIEP